MPGRLFLQRCFGAPCPVFVPARLCVPARRSYHGRSGLPSWLFLWRRRHRAACPVQLLRGNGVPGRQHDIRSVRMVCRRDYLLGRRCSAGSLCGYARDLLPNGLLAVCNSVSPGLLLRRRFSGPDRV